ncbi:hypothetical protein CVT25_004926 [Psilocybe cyanescens]|uniref:Helicase ATP-binding domain-containing protein n=1 Tax=Psilocybe cyanescens TaxID=93625 RepID=A0A409XTW5_PSICY|nr:hypothetical protein CVT25_004926 [Psilocybe cyanescens]
MDGNAPKKPLSILDALDQSFLLTETSPNNHGTPLNRNPLQTPKFEAGASSAKKIAATEALRNAQRSQQASQTNGDNDASFLASIVSSPGPQAGPSRPDFRIHYDQETPLRSIDVGGPDQQKRRVLTSMTHSKSLIAEFVTKSIESTSNGLTVRDAMKKLGLKDHRDLISGLEVRLLSHQVIGVAWRVPSLFSLLQAVQLISKDRMLQKEKSEDKGGILADDMGLGKTVQMIATMAMNMPDHDDDCRTTLIVVPAALLQQWKDEIDTKTNGLFDVHVHHGKDKLKKMSQLKSKDAVVTSYQTLCQDFNVPKGTPAEEEEEWIRDHGGLLSKAKFYRVIADEAQFIRNRSTRSSVSLAHVRAKYRWMLTGTPVTNTLADIYGLLRFGRFRPWNDWNDFNEHVARVQYLDAPLAGSRAQAILKPILLRRTKDSKLEGKPLLQLPTKHIEIVKLQFTPDERQVYDAFEKRTKVQLNRFIRNGTLMKKFVLILRLRQICCHPHLVLSLSDDFEDPTIMVGTQAEKELSRAKKIMGVAWVNQSPILIALYSRDADKEEVGIWAGHNWWFVFLLRAASAATLDFEDEGDEPAPTCPNCSDMLVGDSGRVLICGHEICFDCTLDLSNSAIGHNGIFGQGDEKENIAAEKAYEAAAAKGYRPCPTCKEMVDLTSPDKVFKAAAFEPSEDDLAEHKREERNKKMKMKKRHDSPPPTAYTVPDVLTDSDDDDLPEVGHIFDRNWKKAKAKQEADSDDDVLDRKRSNQSMKRKVDDSDSDIDLLDESISQGKRHKNRAGGSSRCSPSPGYLNKGKGKGRASSGKIDDGPSDAVVATWRRGDEDLEPSSKMVKLIEYLKEWEYSGDKTICYSQWTSMLDLMEKLFSRHGIRSLRFDGKMNRISRDSVLAKFKQAGGPKVILISLNLVSANRIINMDLSWNYAAEAQAYDRCHRIGQEKEVFVKRLVVEDTIEDRMSRQARICGLAEAALGEGTGAKLHALSVKDIRYLFGMKDPNARQEDDQSHEL